MMRVTTRESVRYGAGNWVVAKERPGPPCACSAGPNGSLVLIWHHEVMAMNLRVPEELDRRLDQLAAEGHTSKSALLLQGAVLVLQRHRRNREIGEGLEFVMSHDAELLTRLEDG